MEKIGAIEYFKATDVMGMLDRPVRSPVAVLAMAKKAGVGRQILGVTLFTAKDVRTLNTRPNRGRPIGTGHPTAKTLARATAMPTTVEATVPVVANVDMVVDMPNLDLPIDADFV